MLSPIKPQLSFNSVHSLEPHAVVQLINCTSPAHQYFNMTSVSCGCGIWGVAVKSILLHRLLFSQFLAHTHAKPHSVFIAISKNTTLAPTATDVAMGLNSIQFMEKLIGIKNSADIRTYTRSAELFADPDYHLVPGETKIFKLWNFIPGAFKHPP